MELDPYYGKYMGVEGGGYVTTHHVGIIPMTRLGLSVMNETNITTGGFYNSYMNQTTLPLYLTGYQAAYGDSHLLSFGELVSNATSDTITAPGCGDWKGGSIGWAWYQTKITLLSEVQVYGSRVWGGGYDIGEACSQLAAFRMNAQLIHNNHGSCWLRAVASSTAFAVAYYGGNAHLHNASLEVCVRPLLLLC